MSNFSPTGSSPASQRLNQLDPASRCWLDDLRAPGVRRVRKLAELHDLLRRATRWELGRRRCWAECVDGKDGEELAEEIAEDALLAIVNRLGDYRGDSRFTTWAYAFVINMVCSKLAREARRPAPLRLDEDAWERLPDRASPEPQTAVELREALLALRRAVETELTERQRRVFIAAALNEAPLGELCVQLGSNRNAIYKVLFDARRKLRASLESAGYYASHRPPTTTEG